MKVALPDGEELNLKVLSDNDYEEASRYANLDVCPTCKGREEYVVPGIKHWEHRTYRYRGKVYQCNCEAQLALYARYLLAQIGRQYMSLNWDDFKGTQEADKQVKKYLANWNNYLAHGFGLTFASETLGVGKTWAATHIVKELIKQRQSAYIQDFIGMVDAFCDNESKRALEDKLKRVTFLVMDDIRAGVSDRQTDLYAMKFEVVVRHRTNFNLPTIFTTNLTEPLFAEEFPRIHSLIASKQLWVKMGGQDYRKRSETADATVEMIEAGEILPIT